MNGQTHPLCPESGIDPDSGRSSVDKLIWFYMGLLLVIFLIEWTKVALHWHSEGPAALTHSPLASAQERFSDWVNFLPRIAAFGRADVLTNRALGLPYPYPAPSFFILLAYTRLASDTTAAFTVTVISSFLIAAVLLSVHVSRRFCDLTAVLSIWATFLLGFPALFLLDRGNIEIFVWILVTLGVVAFAKDRNFSAAIFFALAACLKIYPALLFLLFLKRQRYGMFAVSIVITIAGNVAALVFIGPDVRENLAGLAWSADVMRANQVGPIQEFVLRWDHSAFALYKQCVYSFLQWNGDRELSAEAFFHSIGPYSCIVMLSFFGIYVLRLRRMPLLNQYVCLTIASVLLPFVSYEYTLVNLYGPFAVLLLWVLDSDSSKELSQMRIGPYVVAASLAVLFAPLYRLAFHHYDGQIKSLLLILLFVLFAIQPLPSHVFGDAPTEPALS